MKLLINQKERDIFIVKEWTTESGLDAIVMQHIWKVTDFLPNHYTGYVKKQAGDTTQYTNIVEVHGDVTFEGDFKEFDIDGELVGFDTAHYGDHNIPLSYVIEQCELLAKQMKHD